MMQPLHGDLHLAIESQELMNRNKLITSFLILAFLSLCIEAERKITQQIDNLIHVDLKDVAPDLALIAYTINGKKLD